MKQINQIKELKTSISNLLENMWEISEEPLESYPQELSKIIDRFLRELSNISKPWIILKWLYVNTLNKMYVFAISNQVEDIKVFSKEINEKWATSIQKNLEKLKTAEILKNKLKREKILNSLNKLWNKLVPKTLTSFLLKEKFEYMTIIPHSFLWNLPWETMEVRKQPLNDFFKITRALCFDILRADIQQRNNSKIFLLIRGLKMRGSKLFSLKNLSTKSLQDLGLEESIIKYLAPEFEINDDITAALQRFRNHFYNQEMSELRETLEFYPPNSFILLGCPFR
jgi:hypothetical protein